MKGKYIALEGVMGIGKTTLTKLMSEHLKSDTMYEIVEENPFLEKFYQDPEHWSFQTECFFLCNRYMQLKKIEGLLASGRHLVGDYHIMKNLIFAELTLNGEELNKYRELYNVMIDGFPYPDIIIYSEAGLEKILRRISLRGRKMEKDIPPEYIYNLIESYKLKMNPDNLEKYYPGTQIIKINANNVDFFREPGRLRDLYKLIDNAINDESIKYQQLD